MWEKQDGSRAHLSLRGIGLLTTGAGIAKLKIIAINVSIPGRLQKNFCLRNIRQKRMAHRNKGKFTMLEI